jgi:hypothetical protein
MFMPPPASETVWANDRAEFFPANWPDRSGLFTCETESNGAGDEQTHGRPAEPTSGGIPTAKVQGREYVSRTR